MTDSGVKVHGFSKLSNKIGYILLKHPVYSNCCLLMPCFQKGVCLPICNAVKSLKKRDRRLDQPSNCLF